MKKIALIFACTFLLSGCQLIEVEVTELENQITQLETAIETQKQNIAELNAQIEGIPAMTEEITLLKTTLEEKEAVIQELEEKSNTIEFLSEQLEKVKNTPTPEPEVIIIEKTEEISVEAKASEIAFDACGGNDGYKDQPWFEDLNKQYQESILDTRESEGDLVVHQGCLSQDQSLFIFIPAEFRCGKIFKYDIANKALPNYVTNEHCARTFGKRNGNSIPFEGEKVVGSCTTSYSGNYFFLDHKTSDVTITKSEACAAA